MKINEMERGNACTTQLYDMKKYDVEKKEGKKYVMFYHCCCRRYRCLPVIYGDEGGI